MDRSNIENSGGFTVFVGNIPWTVTVSCYICILRNIVDPPCECMWLQLDPVSTSSKWFLILRMQILPLILMPMSHMMLMWRPVWLGDLKALQSSASLIQRWAERWPHSYCHLTYLAIWFWPSYYHQRAVHCTLLVTSQGIITYSPAPKDTTTT